MKAKLFFKMNIPQPLTDSAAAAASIRERRNWLIHLLYVRQEYAECMSLVEEQLREAGGLCEYALYVKALMKRAEGELHESLALFQAATMISPQNVSNLKQVGRALFLLGKHKAAIDIYDEAIKYSIADWEVLHSLGMCQMHLKQYAAAEESFKAANKAQRHDGTYLQLGKLYAAQELYEKAIETYLEALEFSPENPELLTTVGLLYLRTGENFRAFDYLGNSLTLDPKDPRTILAAGSIIQDHHDFDVALSKYRVAAQQTPNSAQLWNNVGMAFFGKQNYIAAISCLRRALYLAPFEWIIPYNLGLVFLHTEQYASAFHYLSASINFKPDFASSYIYLGVCLSRLDDFENACSAYEKAIRMDQDHIFHFNYAIMLANHGQTEMAKQQCEMFEALWAQLTPEDKLVDAEVEPIRLQLRKRLGFVVDKKESVKERPAREVKEREKEPEQATE